MCVRLKHWPIDRLRRRQPRYRREPVVLVETVASRQLVVMASDEARAAGIRSGMTLVQARALRPELLHAEHEPQRDARSLEALGRWLVRFSPVVAIELPDAIFVDVTGTERLFHGLARLLGLASSALAKIGVSAVVAIAPTPGAAWALARSGRDHAIVEEDELIPAISPLPVEALRLDPETIGVLRRLGIDTCGQLLRVPRETLPGRFGPMLLTRLDQAMGRAAEPLVPLAHALPVTASLEFDGEVHSFEVLHMAVRKLLAEQVVPQLARQGLGAKRVEIRFRRAYAPPIDKVVSLSRPARDAKRLIKLIGCATVSIVSDEGFLGVHVAAPLVERLTDEQAMLIEHEEQAREAEVGHLIDRLHARFGEGVIVQPQPVESYVPERAYVLVQPPQKSKSQRWPTVKRNDRPPHVLPRPVEVRVIAAPSVEGDGAPASFTLDGVVHRVA